MAPLFAVFLKDKLVKKLLHSHTVSRDGVSASLNSRMLHIVDLLTMTVKIQLICLPAENL